MIENRWSGRRGSNPRRPAWEAGFQRRPRWCQYTPNRFHNVADPQIPPDNQFPAQDGVCLLARIEIRPIEVTSGAALLWRFRHGLDHARLEQVERTTWSAGYCPGFDRALGIGYD